MSKSTVVICSSPNMRGISRYALGIIATIKDGRVLWCPYRKGLFVFWELFGILRHWSEIRESKCVVFANSRVSPLLWPFVDWNKVVVVVHDLMDTSLLNKDMSVAKIIGCLSLKKIVNGWLIKQSLNRSKLIVFNSMTTRNQVTQLVRMDEKKYRVLYPAPSFMTKHICAIMRECTRKVDRQKDELNVLAVSGVSPNKCLGDYLRWFDAVSSKIGRTIRLVIYGVDSSALKKDMRDEFSKRDTIELRYNRPTSELIRSYLQTHLFLSLSCDEGYGIPLADACGFGLLSVVKDISSYREIRDMSGRPENIRMGRDLQKCVELTASVVEKLNSIEEDYYCTSKRVMRYIQLRNLYFYRSRKVMKELVDGG